MPQPVLRTTCPRDCYDACGILVLDRPGKNPLVRGDPDHPVSRGKLCAKCSSAYNGVFQDPSARLGTPRRRSGPKGSGRFVDITWDEALAEIAERLQAIIADGAAATVLNAHYTGTFAMIGYYFPLRFFNRLGATEVDPDTICNKAGHTALELVYGTSLDGFDPRSASDAASIFVWGANPAVTAPHQAEHWLGGASCPVVVVDPLRTATAGAADLHLQPRPGTDAALAFGLLHVLDRDGLCDRQFLAAHTVGVDELLALAAPCTPEATETVTGVPSAKVEKAAHLFGAGPSLLWIGQGLQRQLRGGNIVRAVATLPAVTGAIGRPGGGFLYLNGIETRGLDAAYLSGADLAGPDHPAAISHLDLASAIEDSTRARAFFCWNINVLASNPDQARLRRAMQRDDLFTVVVDLFPTDTADVADIVLPAASFLEHDDLVVSYFNQSISAQRQALAPPGQALPNSEIFRRLASAMGWPEPELHEPDAQVLEHLLAQSGAGLDFAGLCALGTVWPEERPRPQLAGPRLPTPSGRIELSSDRAASLGLPALPQPWADPPPPPGWLRLLSPASDANINSSYGNDPGDRRRAGNLVVTVHPSVAAPLGLSDGDLVMVESDRGCLSMALRASEDVPPGVALVPKGRWPKLEPGGGNVNALTSAARSDMGESSAVHGTEVRLTRPLAAPL